MRRGKVAELEERLNEIRNRRNLLESAFAEKQALLNQLDNARGESMKRVIATIEEQNQRARERNYQFLEDILVASHQPSSSFSASFSSDTTSDNKKRLSDAKKNFVKMMENALPSIHRSESIRLEEKMRTLQMEKMQSLQRREKLRQELVHEEKVKMELELQRRELVQSLALEQRDLMEAEASSAYILAEGRLVDEQIKENVNNYGQQLEYILQDRLRNYSARDALPRMASNPSIPHDHVRPRVVDNHPAESLIARDTLAPYSSEEEEMEDLDVPDMLPPTKPLASILTQADPTKSTVSKSLQGKNEVSFFQDEKAASDAQPNYNSDAKFNTSSSSMKSLPLQTIPESKDDFPAKKINPIPPIFVNDTKDQFKPQNTSISVPQKSFDEDSEFNITIDEPKAQQPSNASSINNNDVSMVQTIESKPVQNTVASSPKPVEQSFVQPIMGNDSELPILKDLDLGRCQSICNQIFSSIVNKVTFDSKVNEIYQEQRTEADIRAVLYHIKGVLDHDNRQVSPRSDKLQGDIVLSIVSAKGEVLMPKEAFAGVVTMDKLRKELKKSHVPGALHFWDAIIKHLQSIVEVDEDSVEYLARCFTVAIVEHVDIDDRDRLHRKLFTLLKVGIIPEEKEKSFADSPYRRNNTSTIPITNTFVEPFAPTAFENKKVPDVAKKIPEFDDDEFIAEDSILEKPPQIKDLDEGTHDKKINKPASRADDVDEFDF